MRNVGEWPVRRQYHCRRAQLRAWREWLTEKRRYVIGIVGPSSGCAEKSSHQIIAGIRRAAREER